MMIYLNKVRHFVMSLYQTLSLFCSLQLTSAEMAFMLKALDYSGDEYIANDL
jgi:hypothetical protein